MTENAAEPPPTEQFAASRGSSGRRSLPAAGLLPIKRPVSQRWRERPRCHALMVARASGGRVVHAIAGGALFDGVCNRVRREKCGARMPVRVVLFLPATYPTNPRAASARCAANCFGKPRDNAGPNLRLHHRAFESRAVLGVVNALRSASTRPKAGPAGIDDTCARHDVGDCAMAGFVMARAGRETEVDARFA